MWIALGLDYFSFVNIGSLRAQLVDYLWFKTLWEFCAYYSVEFGFASDMNIPLHRDGDTALMECFINSGIFSSDQLGVLNRVRKFKKLHALSEILKCDGKSVRSFVLDYNEGLSNRIYSHERP